MISPPLMMCSLPLMPNSPVTPPQPLTGEEPAKAAAAPRAAYIHVPFCSHRCGYCNFTVVAGRTELVPRFLQALECELSGLGQPREVETLFIGGGTPTLLAPPDLQRLLAIVAAWHPLAAGGEYSVEANPECLDQAKVDTLAAAGVNRISLGAQSFAAEKLRQLERSHTAADIARSVRLAKAAGASVSLDLIFAAPRESLASWLADLQAAIDLQPHHVSTYGLTFERGTTFWSRLHRGQLAQAGEELERAMYAEGIAQLTAAGFEHYEVSNFARPGHPCRHNHVYWDAAHYYAAGPGAARYVAGCRQVNHRSTTTWMKRVLAGESPVAESESLPPEDQAREALVLGLRRLRGIELDAFTARFGFSAETLFGHDTLQRLIDEGLLARGAGRLRLTRAGLFVSDSIWPLVLRC